MKASEIIQNRLKSKQKAVLDLSSQLENFSLVTYSLPADRLKKYIPTDLFEIEEFEIEGKPRAMLSAVTFLNSKSYFKNFLPYPKFGLGQTNYRVYLREKRTGEHVVWFLATALDLPIVAAPRLLWDAPWYRARYTFEQYSAKAASDKLGLGIDIEDTQEAFQETDKFPGFEDTEEFRLIVTHPVRGFFNYESPRTYGVYHKLMNFTYGKPNKLYYEVLEDMSLLDKEEMMSPHSILLCPEVHFTVHLPPKKYIRN